MKTKLTFILSLTFLFLFSGSVYGGDFQDGWDAYERKDYKTAYKLWFPLANQGNPLAQYFLGWMYQDGNGVPQDYVSAHMWSSFAVLNWNRANREAFNEQVKYRVEILEEKMTPSQIEKSHQLFDQYMRKNVGGKKTQKEFINIVLSYRDKYNNSKNEIKKTLQRKKRIKSFKYMLGRRPVGVRHFHNWVGKVSSMDTNADGDASVGIIIESKGGLVAELAEKERNLQGVIFAESKMNWLVPGGIVLVNNRQKIKMDDDLFDTIAEMEVGDKVVFSGEFELHPEDEIGRSKGWYIHTANPTEKGAMTSPVFVVGYSDIKKANK